MEVRQFSTSVSQLVHGLPRGLHTVSTNCSGGIREFGIDGTEDSKDIKKGFGR